MSAISVNPSEVGILLIDAQPLFWDRMHGPKEPVLARIEHLLMLAGYWGIPLIATFEHPVDRKGLLPDRLECVFPNHGQRFVKRAYNCCAETPIREAIKSLSVGQLAVAGSETDVCVLQSALGVLAMGYQVFVLEDCLFSSEPHLGPALERIYRAGAIPCTLKTFAYELTGTVDRTPWLDEGKALSEPLPRSFSPPERLPSWVPTR